ncbi:DUF3769 domain-containing protein [Leptolyngbya sp. CCY15150]|uniref:DUF3769 domain-containing protein n=1 Tax=Leptolyngbya sp. CCY15150 TaxID=2767772 RepID=UPI0019501AD9|nr:DUF3769 domain-containing protein [Leptolyngbya sp. CCY15150]
MPYLVEPPPPPPIVRVLESPESNESDSASGQTPTATVANAYLHAIDPAIIPAPSPPELIVTAERLPASTTPDLPAIANAPTAPPSVLGPPLELQPSAWQADPGLTVSLTPLEELGTPSISTWDYPHADAPFTPQPATVSPSQGIDQGTASPSGTSTSDLATMPSSATPEPDRVTSPTSLPELDGLTSHQLPPDSPVHGLSTLPMPSALLEQLERQLTQLPTAQPSSEEQETAEDDDAPASETDLTRPDPIFAPFPSTPSHEPDAIPNAIPDAIEDLPNEDLPEIPDDDRPPLPSLPPDLEFEREDLPELEDSDRPTLPTLPPGLDPEVTDELDEVLPPEDSDRPTLVIPDPSTPPPATEPPIPSDAPIPVEPAQDIVELTADRQDFDETQQVFVAEGNVEMRYQDSILQADRLRVNLVNRLAVADGNVVYIEPGQLLQGDRMEYNFVRREGTVFNASGQTSPTDDPPATPRPADGDLLAEDPESETTEDFLPLTVNSTSSLSIGEGSSIVGQQTGGGVERVRFEAEQIEFYPGGWTATNVRLTNDPFSPPELEIRSNLVTFTRLSPTRSEIRARNPRMVFDQGFSLPLLRDRVIIDDQERSSPLPISIGIDERDRDGVFIERTFEVLNEPLIRVQITPQFYIQRAFDQGFDLSDSSLYGVTGRLDMQLSPTTRLAGQVELTSLNFEEEDYDERIRAQLRISQSINRHTLSFQSAYRDRVFNGSLGSQNVQWSYGLLLTSPTYQLGNTGINLTYQASINRINANIREERREDLLPPRPRTNNRATLTRYEAGFTLSRSFRLWTGEALPATREEGLRFTPTPLVPSLDLITRLQGFTGFYSSGDTQAGITAAIGVRGQLGHLSDDAFDYLAFNLTYSITPEGPKSPFIFDELRDRQVLSGGLVMQLFGPVLIGFQTSYNLTEQEEINTDLLLQYQRRTYSIFLRYSPTRETGSFGLQINDFNWTGVTEPFSESE